MFYQQRFLKMPLVCRVEWAEPGNRINAFEFFSSLCIAKLISPPVDFMCSVSISFSYSAHMAKGPSHMGNTHQALWAQRKLHVNVDNAGRPGHFIRRVTFLPPPGTWVNEQTVK